MILFLAVLIAYIDRTVGSLLRGLLALVVEAAGIVALCLCATRSDVILCYFLVSIILTPLISWPFLLEIFRTPKLKEVLALLCCGLGWIFDIGICILIDDFCNLGPKLSDKYYDSKIAHVKIEKVYSEFNGGKYMSKTYYFVLSYTLNGIKNVDTTSIWLGKREGDSAYIQYHIGQWGRSHCLDSAMEAEAKKVIKHTGFYSKGVFYSEREFAKTHFDIVLENNGVNLVFWNKDRYSTVHIDKRFQTNQYDIEIDTLPTRVSLGIDSDGYGYFFEGNMYSADEIETQCPQIKEFVIRYLNTCKPDWYLHRNEYSREIMLRPFY